MTKCRLPTGAAFLLLLLTLLSLPSKHGGTNAQSVQQSPTNMGTPSPTPGGGTFMPDIVLLNGFLIFFMQVGFVSLELGYSRSKNVRNILLKNIVDILLCSLSWWAVGYAVENGDSTQAFIGGNNSGFFFATNLGATHKSWFFSFTFALATVSIVSGCLAERTSLIAYPILTVVMSMWIHPVVAFWCWNPVSWLKQMSRCQFLDYAGGTVVHVVGGSMGLVGAALTGPRLGRFEDGRPKPMPGHDVSQVAMGTMFLWFGWLSFNCGSLYNQPYAYQLASGGLTADRVALNMTLSAAGGGLTTLFISSLLSGTFDVCILCNGILTGLVAATANCGYVVPWAALVVGILSGSGYLVCSRIMLYFRVDDPCDSTAIHLWGGFIGTILNGAFSYPLYVEQLQGSQCGGFVYTSDGGLQLGLQLLGFVVSMSWSIVFSVLLVFLPLKLLGRLRVDQATELAGLDNMEHGGPAYPEFTITMLGGSRNP